MKTVGRHISQWMVAAMVVAGGMHAAAQSNKGTITPVESDDDAPQKPVLHYYDKHGERLDKPVLYLAELDTATSVRPSSPYPLYNGVSFGVNFADAIMSAIGQKHSSYDISAMVSLHNWFFPIVEAGMGWGHYSDINDLYKIKAHPSMYAKVGINYNFLYKSDPAYMAYIGLRFGVSNCKWDRTDIKKPTTDVGGGGEEGGDEGNEENGENGENGEENVATRMLRVGATEGTAIETGYEKDELGLRCTSIYGEILAGLKVKIAGPFSLGWSVRLRLGLHSSGGMSPWFVPGYGTGPLGFTFNAYLTFGQKGKKEPNITLQDLPSEQ